MIRVDTVGHRTEVKTKGKGETLMAEAACAITSVVGASLKKCDDDPDVKANIAGMVLDSIFECARFAIKQEYGINPAMPVDYEPEPEPEPEPKRNPFTMGMDGKSFLQFLKDLKGVF